MSGLFGLIAELLRRLVKNWPRKLVILLVATGLWWLIGSTTTTITQRSFVIPLTVEGVEGQDLAVGVPNVVDVSVSGPGPRIDRLRPDQLIATLDLTGASGDFDRRVEVQTPSEVRLQSVAPSNVIGFLESIAERRMPVEVAMTGSAPDGLLVRSAPSPGEVMLTGRQQQLAKVIRVLAVAELGGGDAPVLALDGAGAPVEGVMVAPSTVEIMTSSREVLYKAEVVVELERPSSAAVVSATLTRPTATVAGPPELLAELSTARGVVELPTGEPEPGSYTLPVRLELPAGVLALAGPEATVQFIADPLRP